MSAEPTTLATAAPELQRAYVLQLARAIAEDGVIEQRELKHLYEIFAAFEIGSLLRQEVLQILFLSPQQLEQLEIPQDLVDNETLRMSLAKDLLLIQTVEHAGQQTQEPSWIRNTFDKLRLTEDQKRFLNSWVKWENAALQKLGAGASDLADPDSLKELTARAASIGVPLTALYSAGITGFSAVGITSGLAALGNLSGIVMLGLNPMTAGIAALVVGGVTTKKLVDVALKKAPQSKLALEHAAKVRERFVDYIGQDRKLFATSSPFDQLSGAAGRKSVIVKHLDGLVASVSAASDSSHQES